MRPLRLVLAIAACLLAVLGLSYSASAHSTHTGSGERRPLHALFDWRAPSSLFPPSAIISLTDDNSTFFLARPANFGPLLPSKGLSGQLWVGSGFGDDAWSNGGVKGAEGELGCSDVPGWDEGEHRSNSGRTIDNADRRTRGPSTESAPTDQSASGIHRRSAVDSEPNDDRHKSTPAQEDGTDDHLHHPLPPSDPPKTKTPNGKTQGHADIQSIQESAEIAGKIVLLSRGGCGFLEKVKWVQRRGGVALIVGDNLRGGPLVTMYARGDTSNVTIPSLFTSHTTAHLLSSLIPSGARFGNINLDDAKRLGSVIGGKAAPVGSSPKTDSKSDLATDSKSEEELLDVDTRPAKKGWLSSLFSTSASAAGQNANRRPPSSGNIDWILQEDFNEADDTAGKNGKTRASKSAPSGKAEGKMNRGSPDGFVIGVQDWRDPDLVMANKPVDQADPTPTSSRMEEQASGQASTKAGGNMPGSGEYSDLRKTQALNAQVKGKKDGRGSPDSQSPPASPRSWISRVGRPKSESQASVSRSVQQSKPVAQSGEEQVSDPTTPQPHEGLWITLQPTTMSSSPFFDTLLVLVVSPLVTLTVVYALLLVRSRIRRRRWRAPKSVVDRLPVRTYHTIASSTATTSSAEVSPPGSPQCADSTTPLLQTSARQIGQRPRSRTTGEVPIPGSSYASRQTPNQSPDQIQEKRESGLTEWRRKYGGRQKECVVCLDEYVDGVSRVMSLPCGHEFHADCITPWLTTRRRTCPICKGDVVRSLSRANATDAATNRGGLGYDSYDEDDDDLVDGVQRQAAETHNDDPAAAEPIEGNDDDDAPNDLERGTSPDRDR